jgi:hypothetical protein
MHARQSHVLLILLILVDTMLSLDISSLFLAGIFGSLCCFSFLFFFQVASQPESYLFDFS